MAEVRGSEMTNHNTGKEGVGRRATPMNQVFKMAMVVIPIIMDTAGTAPLGWM